MITFRYLLNFKNFIFLAILSTSVDNLEWASNGSDNISEKGNRFKIVFLGDCQVGKTSIIHRITENLFTEKFEISIGIDYFGKKITYQGNELILNMWNTAGQEKYEGILHGYIPKSSIVFIIFDVSNKESFNRVSHWIELVKNDEKSCSLILCGNKIDLTSQRQVSTEEGKAFAEKNEIDYYEVSAKTGENIKNMFYNSIANSLSCFASILDKKNLAQELLKENEVEKDEKNSNEEDFEHESPQNNKCEKIKSGSSLSIKSSLSTNQKKMSEKSCCEKIIAFLCCE